MINLKDWISYFKFFQPRILSVSDCKKRVTRISYLSDTNQVRENTLYIGKFSQAVFRFQMWDGVSLFLVDDLETEQTVDQKILVEGSPVSCGNNDVILLKQGTLEEIYEKCKEFLQIQEKVKVASNELLQVFLAEGSMQSILDKTAELIQNPMMLLDQNYRVLIYSNQKECEDEQWKECIGNGYCSYEFISRFNKLSEIRSSQKEIVPFFAGCMMSPMRRCIAKLFQGKKQVGYLISIESNLPFDETALQVIEISAKLLEKEMRLEKTIEESSFQSVWDILNDAIEGRKDSLEVLQQHLKESGFHQNTHYYMLQVNMEDYTSKHYNTDHFNYIIREVFPKCIFSYYESYIMILAESEENLDGILEKVCARKEFIQEAKIKVTISDPFDELTGLTRSRYQTGRAMDLMLLLHKEKRVGTYEEYRRYDMMIGKTEDGIFYLEHTDRKEIPLFIGSKEQNLYQYDQEHNTEYFKTAYAYSRNSRSLKDTADELHIHKNTISYRISRLKELFDIDLNQASVRWNLCLAYEAYQLIEAGL